MRESVQSRQTPSAPVLIDARFIRDVAKDAMIRFFVPLTAAFRDRGR